MFTTSHVTLQSSKTTTLSLLSSSLNSSQYKMTKQRKMKNEEVKKINEGEKEGLNGWYLFPRHTYKHRIANDITE